jgi:hypothetical protein
MIRSLHWQRKHSELVRFASIRTVTGWPLAGRNPSGRLRKISRERWLRHDFQEHPHHLGIQLCVDL